MAINFKQCKECGNIFQNPSSDICPKCTKEQDEQFEKIKKYLYKNPGAGVMEVAEATEVEEKLILHFLKEGRIELSEPDGSIRCEKCGKAISSGRMCLECSKELAGKLNSVLPQKKEDPILREKSKLHLDINKRK